MKYVEEVDLTQLHGNSCRHGRFCIENDLQHFENFTHPYLEEVLEILEDSSIEVPTACALIEDFKSLVENQLEKIKFILIESETDTQDGTQLQTNPNHSFGIYSPEYCTKIEINGDIFVILTPSDIKQMKHRSSKEIKTCDSTSISKGEKTETVLMDSQETDNVKSKTDTNSISEKLPVNKTNKIENFLENVYFKEDKFEQNFDEFYGLYTYQTKEIAYLNIASKYEKEMAQLSKEYSYAIPIIHEALIKCSEHQDNLCSKTFRLPGTLPLEEKLKLAQPYNLFLYCTPAELDFDFQPRIESFTELLSIAPLKAALIAPARSKREYLLNLYRNCEYSNRKPLTLLSAMSPAFEMDLPRWVTAIPQNTNELDGHGIHHCRFMVFLYEDESIRIMLVSSNIHKKDTAACSQMIWISPPLFQMSKIKAPKYAYGDSPTHFKRDFMRFLLSYEEDKLKNWIRILRGYDFCPINVFFVASVPGEFELKEHYYDEAVWGLEALSKILNQNIKVLEDNTYQVIAMSTIIGSCIKNEFWKEKLLKALCSGRKIKTPCSTLPTYSSVFLPPYGATDNPSDPVLKIVYPSLKTFLNFHCPMYDYYHMLYDKLSPDILQNFNDWKSNEKHMTRAAPRMNCYCRVSRDCSKLSYFFLTSHNLTSSSWGFYDYKQKTYRMRNRECGILFLPKYIIKKDYFPLKEESREENIPIFPLPFDLPLIPYEKDTIPKYGHTYTENIFESQVFHRLLSLEKLKLSQQSQQCKEN